MVATAENGISCLNDQMIEKKKEISDKNRRTGESQVKRYAKERNHRSEKTEHGVEATVMKIIK